MNFDKKIKNILGNNKTKNSSNSMKLPKFNFPKLNLNTKSKFGASPKMQKKWNGFNSVQRNFLRKRLPDSDGDRVPNKFDCNPFNIMRQDFTPFRNQDKAAKMTAARRFGGRNLKGLKKLSQGRDRIVYELDKDKVLKVAKNPGGLTQNMKERDLDYFDLGKNYEVGMDYAVSKKNKPLSPKNKRKLAAVRKELNNVESGPRYVGGVFRYGRRYDDMRTHLSGAKAFDDLEVDNLILSTDFMPTEMFANKQWGEDEEGNLQLNDAGALASERELHNYRVRDFKRQAANNPDKRTPWQLEEWEESKRQRRQYKDKGNYGASEEKQEEWRSYDSEKRAELRQELPDSDGDRVPDEFDCNDKDPMEQGILFDKFKGVFNKKRAPVFNKEKYKKAKKRFSNIDNDSDNVPDTYDSKPKTKLELKGYKKTRLSKLPTSEIQKNYDKLYKKYGTEYIPWSKVEPYRKELERRKKESDLEEIDKSIEKYNVMTPEELKEEYNKLKKKPNDIVYYEKRNAIKNRLDKFGELPEEVEYRRKYNIKKLEKNRKEKEERVERQLELAREREEMVQKGIDEERAIKLQNERALELSSEEQELLDRAKLLLQEEEEVGGVLPKRKRGAIVYGKINPEHEKQSSDFTSNELEELRDDILEGDLD